MTNDELAAKVLEAVQNKPDAIKAISDALAGGDAAAIQSSLDQLAGVQISLQEAQSIANQVKANPQSPAAYFS